MRSLVKYVLVIDGSETWLEMCSDRNDMIRLSNENPGTHVEVWTYHENPDGTHGMPWKRPLPKQS